MAKRYVNKKHLEYVHTLNCCIDTYHRSKEMMSSHLNKLTPCNKVIQAHHLLKPFFSERGMGRKAGDADIIPLCLDCHTKLHRAGNEFKFFEKITNQYNYGQLVAIKTWLSSPYYKQIYDWDSNTV